MDDLLEMDTVEQWVLSWRRSQRRAAGGGRRAGERHRATLRAPQRQNPGRGDERVLSLTI